MDFHDGIPRCCAMLIVLFLWCLMSCWRRPRSQKIPKALYGATGSRCWVWVGLRSCCPRSRVRSGKALGRRGGTEFLYGGKGCFKASHHDSLLESIPNMFYNNFAIVGSILQNTADRSSGLVLATSGSGILMWRLNVGVGAECALLSITNSGCECEVAVCTLWWM